MVGNKKVCRFLFLNQWAPIPLSPVKFFSIVLFSSSVASPLPPACPRPPQRRENEREQEGGRRESLCCVFELRGRGKLSTWLKFLRSEIADPGKVLYWLDPRRPQTPCRGLE